MWGGIKVRAMKSELISGLFLVQPWKRPRLVGHRYRTTEIEASHSGHSSPSAGVKVAWPRGPQLNAGPMQLTQLVNVVAVIYVCNSSKTAATSLHYVLCFLFLI